MHREVDLASPREPCGVRAGMLVITKVGARTKCQTPLVIPKGEQAARRFLFVRTERLGGEGKGGR